MQSLTQHPSWCSRPRCTIDADRAGGRHHSRPFVLHAEDGARLAANLWATAHGRPCVTLVARAGSGRALTDLTLSEARELRHALSVLLDAARGATA